jgi:hypothetical protein
LMQLPRRQLDAVKAAWSRPTCQWVTGAVASGKELWNYFAKGIEKNL